MFLVYCLLKNLPSTKTITETKNVNTVKKPLDPKEIAQLLVRSTNPQLASYFSCGLHC